MKSRIEYYNKYEYEYEHEFVWFDNFIWTTKIYKYTINTGGETLQYIITKIKILHTMFKKVWTRNKKFIFES